MQVLHRNAIASSRPTCPVVHPKIRSSLSRRSARVNALFGLASPKGKIYDYKVKDIDGRDVQMGKFKGQVVLIVNLASQCGFTPQYTELQNLYQKYSKQKFTILGFPCNQFGSQEPGDNKQIKSFASNNYKVKFPLMSKVDVNGSSADPLFGYLKNQKGGILNNDIKWNFTKFLVDRDGNVVERYPSTAEPEQIGKDIEKYL